MDEANRFADLAPQGDELSGAEMGAEMGGQEEAQKANRFADLAPDKPLKDRTSATGAFARSAAMSTLPAAGTLAGAGFGAQIGGAVGLLGGPAAPVTAPVGAFLGGLAGGFGGAEAVSAAQDWALSKLPDSWRDPLEASLKAGQEEHPTASFIGGLAPFALAMKPTGLGAKAVDLPENATAIQRLMANPTTARLFGGVIQGGLELGQELRQGEAPDWTHVGIATGFGIIWNKPRALGETIENAGAFAAMPIAAPIARTPAAQRGRAPLAAKEVLAETAKAPRNMSTLAEAHDLGVMGPGTTEETHDGALQRTPEVVAEAQDARRQEMEPTPLDIEAQARQREPEAFDRAEQLDWEIAAYRETGQTDKLREAIAERQEVSQTIAGALRHADEYHNGPAKEDVAEKPQEPEDADEWERQRQEILAAEKVKLTALGVREEQAAAQAEITTQIFMSRASWRRDVEPLELYEQEKFGVERQPFNEWLTARNARKAAERAKAAEKPEAEQPLIVNGQKLYGEAKEQLVKAMERQKKKPEPKKAEAGATPEDTFVAGGVTFRGKEAARMRQIVEEADRKAAEKVKADEQAALKAEAEAAEPGDIIAAPGHDGGLLVAAEHEGVQVLVDRPNEDGKSQAFIAKPGETPKPLPEPVDFPAVVKAATKEKVARGKKKAKAGKEPAKPQKEWRPIGKNAEGKELFEDERGVRSYVEDGIRLTEPVALAPTRTGMDFSTNRDLRPEYLTAEERAVRQPITDEAAPAPAPVSEAPAAAPAPAEKPAYGANNKLVTQERADALRERLKQKLRESGTTLNAGIDPEFLQIGTELAVFHVEAGARSFAHFAKAIAGDLGARLEDLRPYLRSWYNGARDMMEDHGLDVAGLDHPDTVRTELARLLKEEADAGSAVHDQGAQPLEEVAAENGEGTAGGGHAEPAGAGGEQTGLGADSQSDVERVATARSGRNGAAGDDTAAAGEVTPAKKRKARAAKVAVETEAKAPGFDEAAAVAEHETANVNVPGADFVLTDDMAIGRGTETEKYADNVAAIRTLKKIEAEDRRATEEEKAILARYVGWGGLKNAFRAAGLEAGEGSRAGWEKRVAELEGLLTPAELRRARNSTAAAHYTSPTVVKAIWRAVERLGFAGGSVLEPSVGTGNFIGFMPESAKGKSNVFAVEYDGLTARIAQKLYPQADILHSGFQDVPLPVNQFALAIGNPPFGRDSLYFRHKPFVNGRSIHNQFFLASMDGVQPGGMMAMVVSHNLMDALDKGARMELARHANLMGAIRLPDTAFKENARTEVVTDILFFKKRLEPLDAEALAEAIEDGGDSKWVHSQTVRDPSGATDAEINVNGYFLGRPEMVIGKIDASGTMNMRQELNVKLDDPSTFEARLQEAIDRLPRLAPQEALAEQSLRHYKTMAEGMRLAVERAEPGRVVQSGGGLKTVVDIDAGEGRAKSVLREIDLTEDTPLNPAYSLNIDGKWQKTVDKLDANGKPVKVIKNGKPTTRNEKETVVYDSPADIPTRDKWGAANLAKLKAMLPIRDKLKEQLRLEMQDAPAEMIEANRAELAKAYDDFVKEHGVVNAKENAKLAGTMPDGGLILATEHVGKKGEIEKAAILSRRVTEPPKPIERVKTASDAVAISLAEHGRIDLDRVASLLGTDEAGAIKALSEGDKPRAFFDPESNRWEPADLYLQGLVRKKLLAAKAAGLESNVDALQAVQPEPWDASQIVPNMGSNWIPAEVYAGFLKYLGYDQSFVHYSPVTNTFTVGFEGQSHPQWATSGAAFRPGTIVEKVLNSRPLKVTFKDDEGKTHVDEEATAESQAKANELFNEFLDWAYQDDDRRSLLTQVYNDKFNTRVVGQRDGSHLQLPGKVPDEIIKMRRHQMNAIWRGVTDRVVLYDHVVGAGKTFTAIARIMERRRMGLSRKPLVVVPNHLVEQWAEDVAKLYPGSNILAAGAKDFERANRRKLFARIASGDYDMTIIGHSSFGFIDIDPSTEARYLEEELRSAQAAITEAEEAAAEAGFSGWGKPMGVREAEALVTKIEGRLAKLREGNKDRLLTFEEMGVDDLTVDEAHEFKNLAYSSRLTGVSGMGNKAGSKKATDLNLKIRALHDRPGTSVAFLTGTPISNSVSEMWLLLKNLVPNELKELGLDNFDAWRAQYVTASSAYEPTEAGGVKEVARLGREWSNMRSLMDLYYSVSDAVTTEAIQKAYSEDNPGKKFPIPDVASKKAGKGDREMVAVKPTPEQREVLRDIVAGFNELPGIKNPIERGAERLRLMDRARKISLDPRAVDPSATVASEGGKISAIVDNVARIYHKSTEDNGTQIIFLDRSVPKAKGDDKIIKAYDDLIAKRNQAVEKGDLDGEQKANDALEKFDANEIESLRAAQAGGWNAYDEIKRQLAAKGVPEDEIRFVQEAQNDEQKADLFEQVRNGEVRVLIGSTPRMGAGTNVQDRLVALHHGDVTWKPSDIEQREGRIVRQGNKLLEKYGDDFAVDVMAYATEMTVDAKMWALNATKLKAINGIRKYDGSFNMEFEDEESASMAEMAALATGNPLMVERVTLNGQIGKLEVQQRSFLRRQNAIRDSLASAKRAVEQAPGKAENYRNFAGEIERQMAPIRERSATRSVTIDGKPYASMAEAESALSQRIEEIRGGDEKARWSVDINGEKVTNRDAATKALRQLLGTKDFEAKVDGQTYIDAGDAAMAIVRKAEGKGDEYTLDGLTLNGLPVEIDVEPYKFSTKKEREITFSVLNDKGQQLAGYRTIASERLGFGAASAGLAKLREHLNPESYRSEADRVEADAAKKAKDIPGLETEAAKTWPGAEELEQKRARLQDVIGELKDANDAARLSGAAEGAEEATASNAPEGELYQRGETFKKGVSDIDRRMVTLFERADFSTLAHEGGHFFLDMLRRDARHPDAPEQLKKDFQTVLDWFNAGAKGKPSTHDEIQEAHHEKFARAWERYIAEGRAPSQRLARVFEQMKQWMLGIYRALVKNARPTDKAVFGKIAPEIDPSIRAVFDRMLTEQPRRRALISEPKEKPHPTLADVHHADAEETEPQQAGPAADQIEAEIARQIEDIPDVIRAEIEPKPEPGAEETGPAGAGGGERAGGGAAGESGSDGEPGGGETSVGTGEIVSSGGETAPQASGVGGAKPAGKPAGGGSPVESLAPRPVESPIGLPELDRAKDNLVREVAGDNVEAQQALADLMKDTDNFVGDTRGQVTHGQTIEMAAAMGVSPEELQRTVGQAHNAEQLWTYFTAIQKMNDRVWAAGQSGNAALYEQEKALRAAIIKQFVGARAEAGRSLNIFNRMLKEMGKALPQDETFFQTWKEITGREFFQSRLEAAMAGREQSPQGLANFLNDAEKRTFGRMVFEYWVNGLISGPITHTTYAISNLVQLAQKLGPETAVGSVLRVARGQEKGVRAGEIGAGAKGLRAGFVPATEAAIRSLRSGSTVQLPGERPGQLMYGRIGEAYHEDATWHDARASAFGLMKGLVDAFRATGPLAEPGKSGSPLVALEYSSRGLIPNVAFAGGTLPVGDIFRAPGNLIAAFHTFTRALAYSVEKNALAYRTAAEEGLTGATFEKRVAELTVKPTQEMMEAGHREAMTAALMGSGGTFTRKLSSLVNQVEVGGWPVGKFIMPFVHISTNILEEALLKRTAMGWLAPEIRADLLGKNGELAQQKAQARMLWGSALAMTIGTLAAQGIVTGSGPEDYKERAVWQAAGKQPYSVKIGDTWYSYKRLGPLGVQIGIAADMADLAHRLPEEEASDLAGRLVHAIAQNVLDESFVRGPADLLRAIHDPDRYGGYYVRSQLASFTPFSVGMSQIARNVDPYTRDARTVLDAIKNKIPVVSEGLRPKLDIWGNPIPSREGFAGEATAIWMQKQSDDPVNQEMLRLGYWPDAVGRKIRGVDLTDEQHDEFAVMAGHLTKQNLDRLVTSPQWASWPDYVRKDLIETAFRKNRNVAREWMLARHRDIAVEAVQRRRGGLQ